MKVNILVKTLIAALGSLIVMMSSISWYNNSIQADLINTMQNKQEKYIVKQLNNVEQDKINTTVATHKKLSKTIKYFYCKCFIQCR